jgi:hypothetical protein
VRKLSKAETKKETIMPKRIVRYPEDSPAWVWAEEVKINKKEKTAVVEVWGYEFEEKPIQHEPSDRFSPEVDYVVVKHPSGNWLKAYW